MEITETLYHIWTRTRTSDFNESTFHVVLGTEKRIEKSFIWILTFFEEKVSSTL